MIELVHHFIRKCGRIVKLNDIVVIHLVTTAAFTAKSTIFLVIDVKFPFKLNHLGMGAQQRVINYR